MWFIFMKTETFELIDTSEKFEDTKGVIRSRTSKIPKG
jgi:hypothetical protein